MPHRKLRAARQAKHDKEIQASQTALRESIAETGRLVDEADAMLRRHRKETEEDDAVPEKMQGK